MPSFSLGGQNGFLVQDKKKNDPKRRGKRILATKEMAGLPVGINFGAKLIFLCSKNVYLFVKIDPNWQP